MGQPVGNTAGTVFVSAVANLTPLFILLRDMNLLNTLWALIFVGASTGQAVAIFVMRRFIEEIPHELFEAAEADGAGHFWQFFSYSPFPVAAEPWAFPLLSRYGRMSICPSRTNFTSAQSESSSIDPEKS